MTLQKKLQINIVMSNYNQRSSSYSSIYDYIFLDNLASSSYSIYFRSDLKNLKIKTSNGSECQVLYIPSYGSQQAAIIVRVPVSQISQTTRILLDVHDTGTTFSSTLTTGNEVLMFDANSDTFSQFFMNYSGLSINNDSTDGGKFLRARFVPSLDGSSWDTESLDPYSVIPLKHSGGIQMYLAKTTGPVYMGVKYGVFGKFKFMTQAAYDALSSYDNDTIYFVRSS